MNPLKERNYYGIRMDQIWCFATSWRRPHGLTIFSRSGDVRKLSKIGLKQENLHCIRVKTQMLIGKPIVCRSRLNFLGWGESQVFRDVSLDTSKASENDRIVSQNHKREPWSPESVRQLTLRLAKWELAKKWEATKTFLNQPIKVPWR